MMNTKNNNMPKVSVIIPIYGVEKYIERCARSLFEQTLDDIEFIFVDDCTPDRSIDILKSVLEKFRLRFAEESKVVRIVRMPTNSGQAAVRRHGIQLATGDYIIHCDSDDWVDVTMYEKMYNKAIEEDADIVVCDYYLSDGEYNKEQKYLEHPIYSNKKVYWSKFLRGEASTSLWSKLVRRSLYINNEIIYPTCNMWEDFVITCQLISHSNTIGYVDECLYFYYNNPQSICNSNIDRNQKQIMENANIMLFFLQSPNNKQSYTKEDIVCFKYYSRYELSKNVQQFKYWKLWHKTFPEIKLNYLFIKDVKCRERLRFLSIYVGLYPQILKILSFLRNLMFL